MGSHTTSCTRTVKIASQKAVTYVLQHKVLNFRGSGTAVLCEAGLEVVNTLLGIVVRRHGTV